MEDLQFYIPVDIPPEISAYDSKLEQLQVGRAGKLGALMLRLERDDESGKTCVKEQYSKVPLYTQRALYLEETLPSMAYMFIISPSGGILQGDRYRMDISLGKGAYAHLTTQGATRVYRMEKNYATQIINISVDDSCYFEFVPDQIIPYRNSRFYQTINLKVHDNATLIYSEIVVPGRVTSGESFQYDICYMKITARNQNNSLRLIDVALLEPKKRKLKIPGILENFDVVGSVYILCPSNYVEYLCSSINQWLDSASVSGGATVLANQSGVIVRILGDSASNVRSSVYEIMTILRKLVLGANFSGIRKA